MKRILYKSAFLVQLVCMAVTFIFMSSCEEDDAAGGDSNATPVITEVRNYAAAPEDTLITTMNTGQWVVLHGKDLSNVVQVLFGGTLANLNVTFVTNATIVVQIPDIPFQLIPAEYLNTIIVITAKEKFSVFTLESPILGPPLITHVRNHADSPNDTLLTSVVPGQQINLIGHNLKNATEISFQGVSIDSLSVVYTDTSAIVQVPEDFSMSNLSLKNRISYATDYGTADFSLEIVVPIEVGPLLELLTGGVGPGKTWRLDFDAAGVSTHFNGPLIFSGHEVRWEWSCATEGGNCWFWDPTWQTWMPAPADYGTMKFSVDETGLFVTVVQKAITTNGTFVGGYGLNEDTQILSFGDLIPLNMGWNNVVWSQAYLISLTEDTMQLGFKHGGKDELEIYNYVAQ